MPKIRLLDQATVNKIAAGEVIERPYSIVKEMVENAIDAGATKVTIQIQDGGISLIRITDNGCGIEPTEVRAAFLRHSTSKIRKVEDLLSSTSLGFRGEALASIAAVSRTEMVTRTAASGTGVRYVIEGGEEKLFEETACPVGTSIRVENLFYNTPVRLKFLKKPAAEAAAITDLVQKMALGHPEVAFRYFNGKNEAALQSPGTGNLKNDVFAVYGRDIVDKLIRAEGEIPLSDGQILKVDGFISRPQLTKASRSYENFFINGRYIRSALLEKAVDEAYKDYIVPGNFPVAVLYLSMDPGTLDVNIHPTKMEIRFLQEDKVRFGLFEVISETLRQQDLIRRVGDFYLPPKKLPEPAPFNPEAGSAADAGPNAYDDPYQYDPLFSRELTPAEKAMKTVFPEHPEKWTGPAPKGAVKANDVPIDWTARKTEFKLEEEPEEAHLAAEEPEPLRDFLHPQTERPGKKVSAFDRSSEDGAKSSQTDSDADPDAADQQLSIAEDEKLQQAPEEAVVSDAVRPADLRLVGQVFRTYWIAEQGDVVYLVDQHAAHERVLYDRYRKLLAEGHMDTQELMEPSVLSVNPKAVAFLPEYQDVLTRLGYKVEAFGEDALIVRGVPFLFGRALPAEDMTKIIDMLYEGHVDTARDLLIDKIASMSCKAAIKGNDAISFEEAKSLLDQLFASENPYNCPHGRPTIISVTKYQMEKRFLRT
ncbi:MAG: DNA mismatch repair endonuclease MutL [Firmicutes bacterium]|nr:DNA mismatch repair endonuclease MutL [Bacillota bacterium]